MEKFIETSCVSIWLDDGILHAVFHKGAQLSLADAKEMVEERWRITEGKTYPLYIDVHGLSSMDAEARQYMGGFEASYKASAAAFFVRNPREKFLINTYLTIEKPATPVKLFNSREKALRWLRTFRNPI